MTTTTKMILFFNIKIPKQNRYRLCDRTKSNTITTKDPNPIKQKTRFTVSTIDMICAATYTSNNIFELNYILTIKNYDYFMINITITN